MHPEQSDECTAIITLLYHDNAANKLRLEWTCSLWKLMDVDVSKVRSSVQIFS